MHRAGELFEIGSLLPGHSDVERQENRRGGVDGHRSGDLRERDAFEQRSHIFERADGHADFAHLAARAGMVGIEAHLRGQIERHREAGLALRQQVAVALVGLLRGAETGVLPHCPELAAVHRGIDSARIGKFARGAEGLFGIKIRKIFGRVYDFEWDTRQGHPTRAARRGLRGFP